MITRLLGVILWVITIPQPQIGPQVVILWAIAFVLMAYRWTVIFPSITFAATLAMRIYAPDTTGYFVSFFLVVMLLMITVFTVPYGSVRPGGEGDSGLGGVEGGSGDFGGGDGGGDGGGGGGDG